MFHQPEIFMSFLQLDMVQHSVWFDQDLGRTISKTYGIMASMVIAFDDFGFGTWIYDNDIFGNIKFLLLTPDKMDQVDRLFNFDVSWHIDIDATGKQCRVHGQERIGPVVPGF